MKKFFEKIKVLSLIILTLFNVSVLSVGAMYRPRPYSANMGGANTILSIIERLEEMNHQLDLPETDQTKFKKELITLASKFVNRSGCVNAMGLAKWYRDCDFASPVMNKYFLADLLDMVHNFYYNICPEYKAKKKNTVFFK